MADLYEMLAEALSQPSRGYQAAQEAFGAVKNVDEGLRTYKKRQFGKKTLGEVLGQSVPSTISDLPFENVPDIAPVVPLLKREDNDMSKIILQDKLARERQKISQDSILARQRERQKWLSDIMPLTKGNKDAVNQAKNAVQGLDYVNQLWSEMDKLGNVEKIGASISGVEKMYPTINTLKKNVRRTAGFSEGGKNLTENELDVVVESFEPTGFDDAKSRVLKKKIAQDFYMGTIDLYEAARLLGPAGSKLIKIADDVQRRDKIRSSEIERETGLQSLEDDPFLAEGVELP